MAKAGIVYVGTDDGLITYSDPGGSGRWRRIGQTLAGNVVRAIATRGALDLVVLADPLGLQQSSDGGQTWQPAPAAELEAPQPDRVATASGPVTRPVNPPAQATALALLAGKQEVWLAAAAPAGVHLLQRSADDGQTWQPAAIPALRGTVTVIQPATYHIDTAWAGSDAGELLRSDDRGRNWQLVASEPVAIRSLAIVRLA